MKTQHSPAPWGIIRRAGEAIAIYSGARRIATVPHPDRTEPNAENEANAQLIQSAPDLFDLVALALPYVEEGEEFNHPTKRELSKRIREEIAKLEGGTRA